MSEIAEHCEESRKAIALAFSHINCLPHGTDQDAAPLIEAQTALAAARRALDAWQKDHSILVYDEHGEPHSEVLHTKSGKVLTEEDINRFAEEDASDPRDRPIEEADHWMDGSPFTKDDHRRIALLRDAGCVCLWPLLGERPGVGPRCRLCGTEARFGQEGPPPW